MCTRKWKICTIVWNEGILIIDALMTMQAIRMSHHICAKSFYCIFHIAENLRQNTTYNNKTREERNCALSRHYYLFIYSSAWTEAFLFFVVHLAFSVFISVECFLSWRCTHESRPSDAFIHNIITIAIRFAFGAYLFNNLWIICRAREGGWWRRERKADAENVM